MSTRWSKGRGKYMRKFRCKKKKKQEKKKRSNSKSNRERGERERIQKSTHCSWEASDNDESTRKKNWVCCLLTASEPPFCFTITSSAVIRFYTSEKRPQSTSAGKPHSASRAHNAVFFFPLFFAVNENQCFLDRRAWNYHLQVSCVLFFSFYLDFLFKSASIALPSWSNKILRGKWGEYAPYLL